MKLTILVDHPRWEEKRIFEAAKKFGCEVNVLNCFDLKIDLEKLEDHDYGDVILQRCISHYRGLYISVILEQNGFNVINSSIIHTICSNKLLLTSILKKKGIPMPKTYIAFNEEKAIEIISSLGYRCVIKPLIGSWGRNVIPIVNEINTKQILSLFSQAMSPANCAFYIQELVDRPPRDIRVIIAGDEIISSVYRISRGSWSTNVAQGAYTSKCEINTEIREICEKIMDFLGEGIYAIDILESPKGYLVTEVNSVPEFRGAQMSTDHDIAGKIVEYLLKFD